MNTNASSRRWGRATPSAANPRFTVCKDIDDGGWFYGVVDTRSAQMLSIHRGIDAKEKAHIDARERNDVYNESVRTARQTQLLPFAAAADGASEEAETR